METLSWSGTFANDKAHIEEILGKIENITGQILTKYNLAKTYWVDDNDPKGNELKADADIMFEETKASLQKAREAKDTLFADLDAAMKNTNG